MEIWAVRGSILPIGQKKFVSVLEEISLLGSKGDQLLKVRGGSGDVSFVKL